MAILQNEITINASLESIWKQLSDVALLDAYDPTIKKSELLSTEKTGLGAKRKVHMLDGKNWFDEKITVFKPQEALTYQLTACTFPIKSLQHSYRFERIGDQVKVLQTMEYEVKFGLLGKLMNAVILKKQFDSGIKKFFSGLKAYAESH